MLIARSRRASIRSQSPPTKLAIDKMEGAQVEANLQPPGVVHTYVHAPSKCRETVSYALEQEQELEQYSNRSIPRTALEQLPHKVYVYITM